jgi:YegS/Rv2252/BmrU family lipid kinase
MYHIIINPIAGRGRTLKHLPFLTKIFDENKIPYATFTTDSVMDGYEKAKDICENADSLGLIGVGGDGTFQEIAAGMADACGENGGKIPVPLGIFPAGSGNDFIMTLEGGKKAALSKYGKNPEENAHEFFKTLTRGKTRAIDIITANGAAYLNIGNIGLDARIVQNAGIFKKKYGRQAYLAAVYKSIARHKNLPLVIEANGEKWEGEYTLVAVCNGQYYGGGMRIAPMAGLDDGKITLCLVEGISRPKTMILFPSLMIEKHVHLKQVKFIECESVRISLQNGAETLCLDGNLYPNTTQIEFKIHPKALDVFV